MHIENQLHTGDFLFLFAHQDDEFGVFQLIIDAIQAGNRVYCAYMTNGAANGDSSAQRNEESLRVLARLGIERENIFFPGTEIEIPDGRLVFHLQRALGWVTQWLSTQANLTSVFVPAWEGGHPDHDALHALMVRVMSDRNDCLKLHQFALYNGYKRSGFLFDVLSPLSANGKIVRSRIPLRNRILFLRFCCGYRSQASSWLGLFPFVLLHYLFRGTQEFQEVAVRRIEERPHLGALYYEKRGMFTWQEMHQRISEFV